MSNFYFFTMGGKSKVRLSNEQLHDAIGQLIQAGVSLQGTYWRNQKKPISSINRSLSGLHQEVRRRRYFGHENWIDYLEKEHGVSIWPKSKKSSSKKVFDQKILEIEAKKRNWPGLNPPEYLLPNWNKALIRLDALAAVSARHQVPFDPNDQWNRVHRFSNDEDLIENFERSIGVREQKGGLGKTQGAGVGKESWESSLSLAEERNNWPPLEPPDYLLSRNPDFLIGRLEFLQEQAQKLGREFNPNHHWWRIVHNTTEAALADSFFRFRRPGRKGAVWRKGWPTSEDHLAAQNGNQDAVELIRSSYHYVVWREVRRYAHVPISPATLEEAARRGLDKAIQKFDPQLGFRFHKYSQRLVRYALLDLIRKEIKERTGFNRSIQGQIIAMRNALDELQKEGVAVTDKNLASRLRWHDSTVKRIRDFSNVLYQRSLDETVRETKPGSKPVHEYVGEEETEFHRILDKKILVDAMNQHLNQTEKALVYLRYFLGLNLQQIGEHLKLESKRVEEIHTGAIGKLREGLRPNLSG